MTGTEGERVPKGSFELDPASLPLNSDDIWYPGKVKEDRRTDEATDKVRRSPVRAKKKRNLMSSCPSTDLGGNCVKKSRGSSLKEEPYSGQPSSGAIKPEHLDDSEAEPDSEPEPIVHVCPDPEFSDFDKHKAEKCFAVGQVWACYDTADGMPRSYAQIRKVLRREFNIKFRWLEAHSEYRRKRAWFKAGLPVGCGEFKRGGTDFPSDDPLSFSHQVKCEKGKKRGMYTVYPMKGETWALFKDWDIRWSSDPENHRKYKYEIVEILSDYTGDAGVRVGYLDKVTGFLSIFQRTRLTVGGAFFVKPKELYKFSHRIPSFKMTGTEGEGVPVGSFELDPAALPHDPNDIWYPGEPMNDSRTANSEPVKNIVSANPPGSKDKFEDVMTSTKSGNSKDIHAAAAGESAMPHGP